jgi:2-hydroxychromene-2-carboxylate isomerase
MPPRVEFHFDFGSPNAYLCHKVLPSIAARTRVQIAYVPVLLGGVFKLTNNQPPMVQFKGIRNKSEYARLETERFIRKHGLTQYQRNPHFPVNTVQIMRGALVAERDDYFERYIDQVFHHMWEEPKKMDEAAVIQEALDGSGLDARAILDGIQEQAIKDKLIANTEASVARGNFGSPTFFVGDEMFFGKDRLREVEEEIVSAAHRTP